MPNITNKRVLVTGSCGTVGSQLVKHLLNDDCYKPAEVIGIDNNESEMFFQDQRYQGEDRAHFFLADIRDRDDLMQHMHGVDTVFHTAAYKHVVVCERSPMDAVQTNIYGAQNIIHTARANNVSLVIFTSSDKAVNPTNVMGTSKLMGERLFTAANSTMRKGGTRYSSTRFGNVLGSSGSVIPIFHNQIAKGGPITLTDPAMTRFVMSIEQSVKLVIESSSHVHGGEVFITKMPVIRIKDLAEVMVKELAPKYGFDPADIAITEIGSKPGEKLYEELMSDEETRRTIELDDYFAVMPAFRDLYQGIEYDYDNIVSTSIENAYNSAHEPALSQQELKAFLVEHKLLETDNRV